MEFRLLGGVAAAVRGQVVDVGHARQQCVLVALLVDANTVVSVDQLIDRVWADQPPLRVRGTLSTYLTRLRQTLTSTKEVDIMRRPGGYVLTVDDQVVDFSRFRHLVAQARMAEDDADALPRWEQAFELWRGEPFAGLDTPWLAMVRADWEREREAAELDHVDTALRCGRHTELAVTLASRAERRPLDERLAGQLMTALYRSGRQAEALAQYQLLRTRLAEELGADPGPAVQHLHQQILTADPALAAPREVTTSVKSPVPLQLPAGPRRFIGRAPELTFLTQSDEDSSLAITTILGIGGIGKTWLALQWAHQHRDRFPDGQLYVDLRGFDATASPTPATVALRGFLDALGVRSAAVPASLDAQAALYRSLTAGRRMLILLDNARDTAQVTPLLPGTSRNVVLVTSRRHLSGLVSAHGAHTVRLDAFTDTQARQLLAEHLGQDRVAAEPDAVSDLVTWCAGLPLAISIIAARASHHPGFPLAALAAKLRGRPAELDTGEADTNLRSVFSSTYSALSPDAAALFVLLALAPGPDISHSAAASLTTLPPAQVDAALRELESNHLVHQATPDRYRMHDLVRLYAAGQACPEETAALRRLVDFYLHTSHAADRLLNPNRPTITLDPPPPHCRPHPLDTAQAALTWLRTEHANLLAAQQVAADRDWHVPVWGLAWNLRTYLWRQGYLHDNLATWQAALGAARHIDDATVQSRAHRHLGDAHLLLNQYMTAFVRHRCALILAENADDVPEQAHTHWGLAWAAGQQGNHRHAVRYATQALRLYKTLNLPTREADALNAMGWSQAWLGNYDDARTCCHQALALFRKHRHRAGEARTLDSLGFIEQRTGQSAQAIDYYQQAITVLRDLGYAYNEADTLEKLGQTHAALGQHQQAHATWEQALHLYQIQSRTTEAQRIRRHMM